MIPGLPLGGLASGGKTAHGIRVVNGSRGSSCYGRSAHAPGGHEGCPGAGMGLELALEAVRMWVGFEEVQGLWE